MTENPNLLKLLRDNSKEGFITVTELPSRNTPRDVELPDIGQGPKSSHRSGSPYLPLISVSPRIKSPSKQEKIKADESVIQRQSSSSVYAVANPNILRASGVAYSPVKNGYLADVNLQESVSLRRQLVENKENQSPLIKVTEKSPGSLDVRNSIAANTNSIDTNNNSEVYKTFENQNGDVIDRSSDRGNEYNNNMSSSKPLKRVYVESPNLAQHDEDDFRYVNSRVEDYNDGNETYRALDSQHVSPQQHHSPQRRENDYHRYEDRNLKMQSQNMSYPSQDLMAERQYVIRPSERSADTKQHFLLDETGLPHGANAVQQPDYSPEYSGSDIEELHQEKYYQDNMRVRLEEQTQRDSDRDIPTHNGGSDEDFQDSLDFQTAERSSFAHDSLDGDDLDPDQNYGQFRNTEWVNPPPYPGKQQLEAGRRVNQPQNVYQQIPDETRNVRKLQDPPVQYRSPDAHPPRHVQPQGQYHGQVRPNDDGQYGYDQPPPAHYEQGYYEDPYSRQAVPPADPNTGYHPHQQHGYPNDQQPYESVDPIDWPQGEQSSAPVREHYKGSKQPFRHVPEKHVSEKQENSRYENVDEYYEVDTNVYYNQPLASSNHHHNQRQQGQGQGQIESDKGHRDASMIRAVYPEKPRTNYVEMNIDSIKSQGQRLPNSYAKLHARRKDEKTNLPAKFQHAGKPPHVKKASSLGSAASAPVNVPQTEDQFQQPKVMSAENLWTNKASNLSQQKDNRLSGKKLGRLQKFPSDGQMHQSVHHGAQERTQPAYQERPAVLSLHHPHPQRPHPAFQAAPTAHPPERPHPSFQAGHMSPSSIHTLTPIASNSPPRRPMELQPITQEFSTADGQRISVDINLKLMSPQGKMVVGPISQQHPPVGPVHQQQRSIGSMSAGTVGVPYPIQEYRQDEEVYDPRDIFPSPRDAMRAQQFHHDTPRLSHTHPGTNPFTVIPPINEAEKKNKQDIPYQKGNETEGYMANYQKHKNRTYDYKKYTIHDYKKLQNELSVKMGGLGPNLDDDTLKEKTEKSSKRLEYAKLVHEQNKRQVTRAKPPPHPQEEKESDMLDKRKIALQYAKNVPKPTVKLQESPIGENYAKSSPILRREPQERSTKNLSPGSKRGSGISNRTVDIIDLDELQRRHEREKQSVAMIRQNVDSVLEQRA